MILHQKPFAAMIISSRLDDEYHHLDMSCPKTDPRNFYPVGLDKRLQKYIPIRLKLRSTGFVVIRTKFIFFAIHSREKLVPKE